VFIYEILMSGHTSVI